jgi:hypothetical protein
VNNASACSSVKNWLNCQVRLKRKVDMKTARRASLCERKPACDSHVSSSKNLADKPQEQLASPQTKPGVEGPSVALQTLAHATEALGTLA